MPDIFYVKDINRNYVTATYIVDLNGNSIQNSNWSAEVENGSAPELYSDISGTLLDNQNSNGYIIG